MRTTTLLIACALPLAACDNKADVHASNASVNEVAAKVRAAAGKEALVRPGEWQSNITIEEMTIPGMSPEVQEQMKKVMKSEQTHSFKTCITEADVKRPKEDFFAGKNNECRYDHFTMAGGKIDAVMHCSDKRGGQAMRITGTYAAESYDVRMEMKGQGDEAGENMSMKTHTVAHRIGECSAAELADRKE